MKTSSTKNDLGKTGVYGIINTKTLKMYIGSSTMTIEKRLRHHLSLLRAGNHKNKYLQRAWDKYGEDGFELNVLEVTPKKDTFTREQVWLDETPNKYNINPNATGTPSMSQETINKRAKTMRDKYRSGELVSTFKGRTPWNKGLCSKDIDYSHLKVPKTMTDKLKEAHRKTSERSRSRAPEIEVFSLDGESLGTWFCSKELEEWSLTEDNNLPVRSRFSSGRMSKPLKYLSSQHINVACKTGKPYKGLMFKYKKK